ncbi:hypothetical protein [Paraburkholderia sp. BCC1884]|uniref:hypothetical protein n=1 Tax=Paraburkholderia sp. BCC1884 TaxID=2562668 RepID=UPI001183C7E1|nr:hypothetical protein [Paraburkholderia sp. BCC1884]
MTRSSWRTAQLNLLLTETLYKNHKKIQRHGVQKHSPIPALVNVIQKAFLVPCRVAALTRRSSGDIRGEHRESKRAERALRCVFGLTRPMRRACHSFASRQTQTLVLMSEPTDDPVAGEADCEASANALNAVLLICAW